MKLVCMREAVYAWACGKCGTKYYGADEEDGKELASKCEALPVSKPKFKVDDEVVVIGKTTGIWFWKKPMRGQIARVNGPYPPYPLLGYSAFRFYPCFSNHQVLDYAKKGFCSDRHVYFYLVIGTRKDGGVSWFFEEELLPAGEAK